MRYFCCYFFVATASLWAQATSPTINDLPSREFGQPKLLQQLTSVAPNLVEGREFSHPTSVAFDTSVSPPILYVADSFNNRVLAFKNATSLSVCGTSQPTCGFADLVIGQRAGDKTATIFGGPSAGTGALSSGLSAPSAVAVDSSGNLYIADSGNNRILRFPAPFNQTSSLLSVDLVIGQKSSTSGYLVNEGQALPSAKTLFLSVAVVDHVGPIGMTFDSAGNLWVPDSGNNRVLRFPVQSLAANTVEPAADVVLGQSDFISNKEQPTPQGTSRQLNNQSIVLPSSVAFDQAGHFYVADQLLRVLYYAPPIGTFLKAQRILGAVPLPDTGQQALPYPNAYSLGFPGSSGFFPPMGLATLGNNLYVSDAYSNRIVVYDTPDKWPAATTAIPSPQILSVIGQPDLLSGSFNQGKPEPDASTLGTPTAIAFNGTDLWVADSANNRVMSFPQTGGAYTQAKRLVGQLDFPFYAPNLIEGREVFFASGTGFAGLAVDLNSTPPHLYVADSLNNRILGFNDARKVGQGSTADLVIGQHDLYRALINYPNNDSTLPTDRGLNAPTGLVVDANGDLFVADSGNGRVLRFKAPFSVSPGDPQVANLVLGQNGFNVHVTDASDQEMRFPFGLALLSNGALAVSDASHNRVLIFKRTSGEFTTWQKASIVLGQPDFFTTLATTGSGSTPPSLSGMNSPRHIASDSSDRLYVCDSLNGRLLLFDSAAAQTNGKGATFQVSGLQTPQGVIVNQISGEIWVTNTGANFLFRFPEFNTLFMNPTTVTAALGAPSPLAVALDAGGNLIVAEGSNRVTFYFAKMFYRNAANFNIEPLAPGMLAVIGQLGAAFNFTADSAKSEPWPKILSDLQLTVGGTAAPIFNVTQTAVYFQVPMSAPTTGTVEFLLTRPSTGQVMAAGTFPMTDASPGFFTASSNGLGQVAARNGPEGVTANGSGASSGTAPVVVGNYISLYLTGAGFVPGTTDGVTPGVSNTPSRPNVFINAQLVPDGNISYSGLGGFPGGWVINVIVPESVPPGNNIRVDVTMRGIASNTGGASNADGSPAADVKIVTTIAVKGR